MDLASGLLRRRWLARSPLALYRAGASRLLGPRLVMVEHRGRSSGRTRQVVLEVVDRPDALTLRVVSGLGRTSQWFRNIEADSRVRVTCGTIRRRPGRTVVLSLQQAQGTFERYAAVHPRAWAHLQPVLLAQRTGRHALSDVIPVVDLVLDADPGQPMPLAPKANPSR